MEPQAPQPTNTPDPNTTPQPTPQPAPQPPAPAPGVTPPAAPQVASFGSAEKPKKGKKILSIVVSLLAFALGYFLVSTFVFNDDKSPQQVVDDVLGSEEFKEYVSTSDGFKADFPGIPTSSANQYQVQGYDVSLTAYQKELDGGDKVYAVSVAIYPPELTATTDAAITSSLEGSVNGTAQSVNGTVAESSYTTVDGNKAITALITGTKDGQSFEYRTTNVLVGSVLYQITTVNVSQAEHDAFVASFSLT